MKTFAERFWSKVAKGADCWLWLGARGGHGYGNFSAGGSHSAKTLRAHRVAYELEVCPVPEGMEIDHACMNKLCVNPAHLRVATREQNQANMGPNRRNRLGIKGVRKRGSRYHVRFMNMHLGTFASPQEAHAVYLKAARSEYGDFVQSNLIS